MIHGSFRKHLDEIRRAIHIFKSAGITVLAPEAHEVVGESDGFIFFEGEEEKDPRLVELLYLHKIKKLGSDGFSYFVNPEGYIGKSTSYELGIAQVANVPCFFLTKPSDHPAYVHANSMWSPENLAAYIVEYDTLPGPIAHPSEIVIHTLWEDLMLPGSVVATGGIIQYDSGRSTETPELLFVKTHKWGGRYSMVGGKVRRNETLLGALQREIREETGLLGRVNSHVCTFDQIKNSGYYSPGMQHIFVDYVVNVDSKKVQLNEEAQDFTWLTAKEALDNLDIEPNARHTLEIYMSSIL